MKRRPLVIANWKMKMLPVAQLRQAQRVYSLMKSVSREPAFSLVCCPSFESLSAVRSLLVGTSVALGAQDCHWVGEGAYTGEVSPHALKKIGCSYVLVGHSERRLFLGETDIMIAKKMRTLSTMRGLTPVLCIGESHVLRATGRHFPYLEKQIRAAVCDIPKSYSGSLVIAYEPLWAISTMGTGRPIAPSDFNDVVKRIHIWIKRLLPRISVRILYGGSVTSKNVRLFGTDGISDGVLIGGASVDPREFNKIFQQLTLSQ